MLDEDVSVRPVRVADAAGIVALGRLVDENQLASAEAFRALLEAGAPPTTERLVAESDGRIVAWAPSGLYASGTGWFWIGVRPEHRGRGLGGTLYTRIETRLRAAGAELLETTPNDEAGRVFLQRRGFEVSKTMRVSELDPRRVTIEPRAHEGVDVVALQIGSASW